MIYIMFSIIMLAFMAAVAFGYIYLWASFVIRSAVFDRKLENYSERNEK